MTARGPAGVAVGLTLGGLAISLYLTIEHFSASTTLACPATGAIDCVKVTTSRWSHLAGIPVAVLGLAYFVVMALLCLPGLPARVVPAQSLGRVIGAAVGTAMVVYLVYVELFLVDAICLWCTGVHVITVALLGVALWWRERDRAATKPT